MESSCTPFDVYELKNLKISELIAEAVDGIAVIPSIQRPFVWQPHQIANTAERSKKLRFVS